jgi:ABC-type glutathione transport system ATPase component
VSGADVILRADGLVSVYRCVGGETRALSDVSFEIARGERFAVVGESGAGKTTLLWTLLALRPALAGTVRFAPRGARAELDWLALSERARRPLRRYVQAVFQDPASALHPRRPVLASLEEPLRVHGLATRRDARARAVELVSRVGLEPATADRFPHELSLGQAQRACLARALATGPELLLLDEPTSALDVGLQAQIVNLLLEIAHERSLTVCLVSHDLDLVRHFATRVLVLAAGRVVETGPTSSVLGSPRHPHTRALVDAWRL